MVGEECEAVGDAAAADAAPLLPGSTPPAAGHRGISTSRSASRRLAAAVLVVVLDGAGGDACLAGALLAAGGEQRQEQGEAARRRRRPGMERRHLASASISAAVRRTRRWPASSGLGNGRGSSVHVLSAAPRSAPSQPARAGAGDRQMATMVRMTLRSVSGHAASSPRRGLLAAPSGSGQHGQAQPGHDHGLDHLRASRARAPPSSSMPCVRRDGGRAPAG